MALEIYASVLDAIGPERLISHSCCLKGSVLEIRAFTPSEHGFSKEPNATLDLDSFENVFLCGAGKASCGLAAALLRLLGKRVSGGLLITKKDHSLDLGPV